MRSVLLRLWRLLNPQQKRRLLLLQIVSVFMAFSTVAGIAAVIPFFAVLAEPSLIETNQWLAALRRVSGVETDRGFVSLLGLGLVAITVLSAAVNVVGNLAMVRFGYWVGNEFQILLFNEYLSRDYLFHARTNSATLVNNTTALVSRIQGGILQQAMALVAHSVTIAAIIVAIVALNPWIAVGASVVLGGSYALIYMAVRGVLRRYGERMTIASQARQQALQEGFGGIKEIIVLQTRETFRREFQRRCWEIARSASNAQIIGQAPKYLLEGIAVAGLVGAALVLSNSASGVGPWIAQLSFLGLASYRLLPALQWAFSAISQLRLNQDALGQIAPDLERARAARRGGDITGPRPEWSGRPRIGIDLRGVDFRYGADRPLVLRGLSLSVPAGSTVGFVGASGSGKTTTADVLLGLLVPESGSMSVDGETICEGNREAWQSTLAYVPQHIFLTDGSIAENIAFGVDRGAVDMERVREAGRMARLDEFVLGLEQGYETPIGERGVRLSGGQRQRIGIARALYRNASVLVFDEATSALDGLTEQEVMSAIEGLQGQRTIILIAHRLTTVRKCDMIFEFEAGRVVRSGTYDELLQSSDRFRRMAGVAEAPAAAG